MLEELHVCDLALIEDVWLELGGRFTVLTGETGAGKTVVVGALKLLCGERGDPGMVRSGADEALVEGRFMLDGREWTARRRVSSEGRSRCYLNGEMSTVTGLAETIGPAVDLHGQHEHQALLAPSTHATYLDRFIGESAADALAAYRSAWASQAEAEGERNALAEALHDRERRGDALSAQIADIDAVAPRVGEDDEIRERLPMLRHGERLAEAVGSALRNLRDEGGSLDAIALAAGAMRSSAGLDPAFDALTDRLVAQQTEFADLVSDLRRYADDVSYDQGVLDQAEARLAAITDLTRKYGGTVLDVIESRDKSIAQLDALESGTEGLRKAEERVASAEQDLEAAAGRLVAMRTAGVPDFVASLAEAASELAMPSALFEVALTGLPRGSWTKDGPHKVEFLFSPNAGEPPRPLARIASGGEVSRVMLAMKSVLDAADPVPVLVFDEVDAGIGGATALAVGRRLARLAQGHQVLAVTHLAQVAAFADVHLVVEKLETEGRSVTRVRQVSGEERVAEIARMLAGTDTEAGLAHARELLASVRAGTV